MSTDVSRDITWLRFSLSLAGLAVLVAAWWPSAARGPDAVAEALGLLFGNLLLGGTLAGIALLISRVGSKTYRSPRADALTVLVLLQLCAGLSLAPRAMQRSDFLIGFGETSRQKDGIDTATATQLVSGSASVSSLVAFCRARHGLDGAAAEAGCMERGTRALAALEVDERPFSKCTGEDQGRCFFPAVVERSKQIASILQAAGL